MMRSLLEIACFNEESALNAAAGGADRIELCRDYESGGLSPHPAVLQAVKSRVSIPAYVMIRPHSKDFYYDGNEDFETMKDTLRLMDSLGADGFVFGILHKQPYPPIGERAAWVDIARNKELVQLAGTKPCTFHRAFDCIPESDWESALADIQSCGFAAILTSGGPSSDRAVDCMDGLAALVNSQSRDYLPHTHRGNRTLEIIIGGGVRQSNVRLLREKTLANSFHSSALSSSNRVVSVTDVQALKASLLSATDAEDVESALPS